MLWWQLNPCSQESLAIHDVVLTRTSGNALQWGAVMHLEHVYYTLSNDTRRSGITVYFGSVDGRSVTCGVWNAQRSVLHRCQYPFSGVKYADFGGVRILSPADIDMHIAAVYDGGSAKKASPQIRQCDVYRITVAAEVGGKELVLAGPIIKPHLLCTGLTENCRIGVLATPLLATLLQMAVAISLDSDLKYTLACDSLLYATGKLRDTPVYAAIAVPADEYAVWMEMFRQHSRNTSFAIDIKSDATFLVKYSHRSSVQLTVFQTRGEMQLSVARYPGIDGMLFTAHDQADDFTSELSSACSTVHGCYPAQNTTNAGSLYNGFEQQCMDSSKSKELTGCEQAVG